MCTRSRIQIQSKVFCGSVYIYTQYLHRIYLYPSKLFRLKCFKLKLFKKLVELSNSSLKLEYIWQIKIKMHSLLDVMLVVLVSLNFTKSAFDCDSDR